MESVESCFHIKSTGLDFFKQYFGLFLHKESSEDGELGLGQPFTLCFYDPGVGDTEEGYFASLNSLK